MTVTATSSPDSDGNAAFWPTDSDGAVPAAVTEGIASMVYFIQVDVAATGTASSSSGTRHAGAVIARADGTFEYLGDLDDPTFDPSAGSDTLTLNTTIAGDPSKANASNDKHVITTGSSAHGTSSQ
ncbi:MAG: hypothetical protein AAFX79_07540 [Planctomycetota bacterium]